MFHLNEIDTQKSNKFYERRSVLEFAHHDHSAARLCRRHHTTACTAACCALAVCCAKSLPHE